ncbi:MAG: MOSC domain-containing protein [Pseudomonadota bacterium]
MSGTLEQIFYAAEHGAPQAPLDAAKLVLGRGLEGDRHFGKDGGVISLIEAEAIEQFEADSGLRIPPAAMRRNLLTRGVRLNPLVGETFRVGDVSVEGFELCDPCAYLGGTLATPEHSAASIVKAFLVSAGLRAYVRGTGVIRPGDPIG